MNKEQGQLAKGKDKLAFSAKFLAAVSLATAGVIACNDRDTSSSTGNDVKVNTTPVVLTINEMGADAPQPSVTPKVFQCGIECITPEDLEKLNRQGKTVDPITYQVVPLPTPKIFRCDVACIGPAAAETPAPQGFVINH